MMTENDIVLPVFDTVTGTGSNANYHITGFVSVTPCRYKVNNQTGPDASTVNSRCGPPPVAPPGSYIQLRYSGWVPVGSISATCQLGNTTCDTGPRTTVLAD
jgi:hypothetical protein